MENAELIISLIGTSLSFFVTCVILMIKFVRSVKKRSEAQDGVLLLDAVVPLMEIAEKHTNYSGAEKKEFVLSKLNEFSKENGLDFNAEEISAKIEELIKLTKQVNIK